MVCTDNCCVIMDFNNYNTHSQIHTCIGLVVNSGCLPP